VKLQKREQHEYIPIFLADVKYVHILIVLYKYMYSTMQQIVQAIQSLQPSNLHPSSQCLLWQQVDL